MAVTEHRSVDTAGIDGRARAHAESVAPTNDDPLVALAGGGATTKAVAGDDRHVATASAATLFMVVCSA